VSKFGYESRGGMTSGLTRNDYSTRTIRTTIIDSNIHERDYYSYLRDPGHDRPVARVQRVFDSPNIITVLAAGELMN